MQLQTIQNKICELREQRVMFDFDLAELYEIETKRLKEAVRRNLKRFPPDFLIELTNEEWENLRSQIASSKRSGKGNALSSNSVGQRPTYGTSSLSLRPERAIAKWHDTAHALSGLRLLWVASFRRAMPYANAKRALPLRPYGLRHGYLQSRAYTPGYQDVTAMRSKRKYQLYQI